MKRPRILLSLDSSWWNRFGFSRFTYGRMLRRAGCEPRSIRFRDVAEGEFSKRVENIDGVVLSGGGDLSGDLYEIDAADLHGVRPLRDRFEVSLLDLAIERGLPVLGICRGAQLLNVYRGGKNHSLRRNPALIRRHRQRGRHPVQLLKGSRLRQMVPDAEGTLSVSSYHAHAVLECGHGMRPAAQAPDGVVEAIEAVDESVWQIGIQWHPEWMVGDRFQMSILREFGRAARSRAQSTA